MTAGVRSPTVAWRVVALGAPAAFVVLTAKCHGATELQIDVSTDLACTPAAPFRTAIRVGESTSLDGAASADTDACETIGVGDSHVGSLIVTPSGARDARVGADSRAEAARLFAEAQTAEAAHDYRRAMDCYHRSLALVDDPAVGDALRKLMALVGPM
jgi:hypothetical protein